MVKEGVDRLYSAVRRERGFSVSYESFNEAFAALLGRTDMAAMGGLAQMTSPEEVRTKLSTFVGPSGLSLFTRYDHGALLTALGGAYTRAMTWVVGNALIAAEMTREAASVGLYVPLRVFVHETKPGHIELTYDVPSSTLGQFHSPKIHSVAESLDTKLEKLIEDAVAKAMEG